MSAPTLAGKLVVAISSRALFDLAESHRVYTDLGVESYHRYQIEHEDELLDPGPAFALVTKLLRLNRLSTRHLRKRAATPHPRRQRQLLLRRLLPRRRRKPLRLRQRFRPKLRSRLKRWRAKSRR